jgi:hypothetical protein
MEGRLGRGHGAVRAAGLAAVFVAALVAAREGRA